VRSLAPAVPPQGDHGRCPASAVSTIRHVYLLSEISRRKKVGFFLDRLAKDARILEIGSGDGWMRNYAHIHGWSNYLGLDLRQPADIVGDIKEWRSVGLEPESFDGIIAFEVVEHVDCFKECFDLLRPGGLLLLTSPLPSMDWACKMLERARLTQPRTSPHDHLVDFKEIPYFEPVDLRVKAFMSQWGVLRRPAQRVPDSHAAV
jgi:cyclopropane fatty-acyl-phospholipid synthase-like methyltransferase